MFETTNPIYNSVPTAAPGVEGLRHMIGDTVASLSGTVAGAYVPPNMSTFDASLAKHVNGSLYRTMMSNTYRQMGYQIGNTAGATNIAGYFGSMAGLSPEETRRALSGGGASLAGGFAGQLLMPMLDQGMSSIGLTGGSLVAAANAAFTNRMNLMSPGVMNPLDAGRQHQAMGAASAMSSMLNGLMSQTTADGGISLLPNHAVTKGFSRERIANLMMRAAGAGAFTSYEGGAAAGFADRLSEAAGGIDLASLDFTQGDFTGGKNSILDKGKTKKVEALTREFAHRMQGITEAMAAMRDLTNTVDGLEDKLDSLTNGNWLRSGRGGFAASNALRTLKSVTMMHNIDPNQALEQIASNRGVLQSAAGFDPAMQAMGFDGGGMFGLSAQTELLTSVEDMITARGVRGDPVLANRLRMQGVQAMARNMNTMAGRGSQILAYARQTGILSNEEANQIRDMLSSGDRGVMNEGLNQLLVRSFGSREAGERFMNDKMQMNTMRQSMDDDAGTYAMQTAIRGAQKEFAQRGMITASEHRLDFTKQLLTSAGMRSWQSDDDAGRLTESVVNSIKEVTTGPDGKASPEGIMHANAFKEQVDARIKSGMSPRMAFMATKAAFESNPATSVYSETINHAVTRQSAVNNEYELARVGRESYQANEGMRQLQMAGFLKGTDSADIATMLREGKGKEALTKVNSIIGGLDKNSQGMFKQTLEKAGERFDAAKRTIDDNKGVEEIIAKADAGNFGAYDAAEAYEKVAAAAKKYIANKDAGNSWDDFWESYTQSKYTSIFSKEDQAAVRKALDNGDTEFFAKMARQANAVRQIDASNLKNNGYGQVMSGFFGGGEFSGNSPRALEERNKLIGDISGILDKSSKVDQDERSTLAQDITSFFLENKNWKGLLKQYDESGELLSQMRPFAKAFKDYESANAEAANLARSATKAIGSIAKIDPENADMLRESLQEIQETGDLEELSKFVDLAFQGDGNAANRKAVMDYAGALVKGRTAHRNVQSALKGEVSEIDIDAFRKVNEKVNAEKRAREGRDKHIQSWFDELDLDPDSIASSGSKTKRAFSKLKDVVSDKDVAESMKVKSLAGKTEEEITRERFKIAQARAATPGDKDAAEVMRAFKVASNEGVMKLRGKLTIESGNDQQPAVIDGQVAGGLG